MVAFKWPTPVVSVAEGVQPVCDYCCIQTGSTACRGNLEHCISPTTARPALGGRVVWGGPCALQASGSDLSVPLQFPSALQGMGAIWKIREGGRDVVNGRCKKACSSSFFLYLDENADCILSFFKKIYLSIYLSRTHK